METNLINNKAYKDKLADAAVATLLNLKKITTQDFQNIRVSFAYIFAKEDNETEALFKLIVQNDTYFFSFQTGKLSLINIDEELYNDVTNKMKMMHRCLYDMQELTDIEQKREDKNNEYLKKNNIDISKNLPPISEKILEHIKSIDDICQRAIAGFIAIQVAADIRADEYEESLKYFKPIIEKFGIEDEFNEKEKRLFDDTYTKQDLFDMDWYYEFFWTLCWYLGFVDDIRDASELCNTEKCSEFIVNANNSFDVFKSQCKVKSNEEIMEMLDLYYRYAWILNEQKVNPNVSVGNINPSIVNERRRALEWIVGI